jgi:hypothetical protein
VVVAALRAHPGTQITLELRFLHHQSDYYGLMSKFIDELRCDEELMLPMFRSRVFTGLHPVPRDTNQHVQFLHDGVELWHDREPL